MNNIIKRTWRQGSMVIIEDLRGLAFQAEENGHTFEISAIDRDGEPVALSGTPAGVMLRCDNQDVALTCAVSEGKVTATLPANAYAVPGRFALTIFLTSGGQKMAIYAAVGTVKKTNSGTVAPPAGDDVTDLISRINTAINAIPVNYNAAFAVAYENLTFPVEEGTYCIYNGALKKAKVDIATSESYTSSHWDSANFGTEMSSLRTYVDEQDDALKSELNQYNSYDVFSGLLSRHNGTSGGLTYTWNGDVCTVGAGTASNYSANILRSSTTLPEYVKPGETYYVKYKTTDSKVMLRIIFRTSDGTDIETKYCTEDRDVTVPANSSKWHISIFVNKDTVLSSDVTVSDIHFLSAKTNRELEKAYEFVNKGVLPTNTDLDNVKAEGRYFLASGYTYTNIPVTSATGTLEVLHTTDNFIMQRFTGTNSGVMYIRTSLSGRFSDRAWNQIPLMSDIIDSMPNKGKIETNTDIDTIREQGIWFLNSGYTYTHSPFSSTYGGILLVFKYSENSILQIASKANTGELYTRASLLGNFPSTWGMGGAVNNYTTQYYENSYEITCSPTITTDTNNFLASTGDNTDRTGDIQTMLNTTGYCHLGPGRFMVTGIEVPSYATLEGSGAHTLLLLDSSVINGYAVKLKTESKISNMRISGGTSAPTLSATVGTRHGILFEGTKVSGQSGGTTYKRSSVDNVLIRYFEGGGITCTGTGVDLDSSMLISNCFVDHCGAGIYIPYYSEFHRIANCAFTYCWYGCVDNGGNNNFSNCDFSGNKVGILIDNSSDQSPNNSHGTFSGCSVNHSYSDSGTINEGTAIKLLKSNLGEIFTGMQIFYGAIVIDKCVGTRFIGANIGRKVPITITDSTVVTFSNCTFKETWASGDSVVTQSGNTVLKFTDCYLRDGTSYDPMTQ